MRISIVNHSEISDAAVHEVIRAVNIQIEKDVAPIWSMFAELRLEGSTSKQLNVSLPELRGDAVIYLRDQVDVDGALGWHDRNAAGIPYGVVYTSIAKKLGEPWSATLSHEALELLADPMVNLLAVGPHPDPTQDGRPVAHWYELCDAVQDQTYRIDGVTVSDFVLPLYFTPDAEPGSRNSFLGRVGRRRLLPSFGVAAGGYVGFLDPENREHGTYSHANDTRAAKRMRIKGTAGRTRRSMRYLDRFAGAK